MPKHTSKPSSRPKKRKKKKRSKMMDQSDRPSLGRNKRSKTL